MKKKPGVNRENVLSAVKAILLRKKKHKTILETRWWDAASFLFRGFI